jgi:hypothetical protein
MIIGYLKQVNHMAEVLGDVLVCIFVFVQCLQIEQCSPLIDTPIVEQTIHGILEGGENAMHTLTVKQRITEYTTIH